jgi:Fe-S-cluster containining protein
MNRRPLELPLLPASRADELVPCLECGRCCTYVAVGINAPRTAGYAADVLWYLYHDKVYVYRAGDGEWSVHFETRCRHLAPDLKCRIYEQRPHICRGFDNTTCEVNSKEGEAVTFTRPEQFLDWLEAKHPRVYRRLAQGHLPPSLRDRLRPAAKAARTGPARRGMKEGTAA